MSDTEHLSHPFPALYDTSSRVLILGSFPSVVSRKQSFYYANKMNRFWPVLERIFGEEIQDRAAFCHAHHIALWDVIESCTITGSSDTSIKNVKVNDIQGLVDGTNIHTIFTTGGKAASLYKKYVTCDCQHIALPSTSGANARMSLDALANAYQIIKEKVDEEN